MTTGRKGQAIAKSRHRFQVIPRTLCFITHGDDVLLLRGAPTKRLWPNLYNGIGGHIERHEDVYSAVLREIAEETGLTVRHVRLRGTIVIDADDETTGILVFVFTAESDRRETLPSSEGMLEWVHRSEVLQKDLVADLRTVLPRVLAMPPDAPPFFARYSYDERGRLMIGFAPEQ